MIELPSHFESITTLRELHLNVHRDEGTVNYEKVHAIHRIRQEKGLHSVHIIYNDIS